MGIGSNTAQALGIPSLAADMGWKLKLRVHSHATAAIGISNRLSLGEIRHLHCADLWVKEKVRNGDIDLLKTLGTEHPADSKYLDRPRMEKTSRRIELGVHGWSSDVRSCGHGTQQNIGASTDADSDL